MPYQIVETRLDPLTPGRVMEKSPLPNAYATEALALMAVSDLLASAASAGHDVDNGSWWAHHANGDIFSYAIEATGIEPRSRL